MASLKQIAGELDVSYSLVSKVLNDRMGTTGVSATTRKAIQDKARELGYQPNPLAVALKRGTKGAIGVFIHEMGTPGSDLTFNFLKSLSARTNKEQQRIWLRFFSEAKEFIDACDNNVDRLIDGLIVGGLSHPELADQLRLLEKKGVPTVAVFADIENAPVPTNIAVDYRSQCYQTTKHLIDQGCRRIAHLHSMRPRYEGYKMALKEAGIPYRAELILKQHNLYLEGGLEGGKRLLDSKVKFDAVCAQSDAQAVGLLRILMKAGIRVPEDVKVTGVDDSPIAKNAAVPITSTTSGMDTSGTTAIDLLNRKIKGEKVESVVVTPRLEIRESTRR